MNINKESLLSISLVSHQVYMLLNTQKMGIHLYVGGRFFCRHPLLPSHRDALFAIETSFKMPFSNRFTGRKREDGTTGAGVMGG